MSNDYYLEIIFFSLKLMDSLVADLKVLILTSLDTLSLIMMKMTSKEWSSIPYTRPLKLSEIAKNINVDLFCYLPELSPKNYEQFKILAYNGNVEMCKWFVLKGFEIGWGTLSYAAGSGSIEICEWLKSEGCSPDSVSFGEALVKGDLPVCKWHVEQGCKSDGFSAYEASVGGNKDLCIWLHELGIKWDEFNPGATLYTGNRELCKFLLDKGCTWEGGEFYDLMGNLDVKTCEWLISMNCPCNLYEHDYEHDLYTQAIEHNNREVFLWLMKRENKPLVIDEDMFERCRIKTIKWLHSIGMLWHKHALKMYINYHKDKEFCLWMLDNGCPEDGIYTREYVENNL